MSKAEKQRLFKEDSLSLKVGVLPTSDCDLIRKADSLGLFDSVGVVVHLRHYNSLSECRYALVHKLVEGAAIDSSLAKTIESKNEIPLTLSLPTPLQWRLMTSKKSRIMRYSQLTDKMIATDSHGASLDIVSAAIDSITKKDKQVFIIQCEDINIRLRMLETGNVDAAMLPEPYATKARKTGASELPLGNGKRNCGVVAFRSQALKDKRIKQQHDLFIKACAMAKDSIAAHANREKSSQNDK